MFDVGFGELFVIAVIALIVLGPEKLPRAARFAGLWVRKARAQWHAVKSEFEQDLAADELKRSLAETRESLRQAEEQLRTGAMSIRENVEREFGEVAAAVTAGVEPGATTEPATEGASEGANDPDALPTPARHEEDEGEMHSLESASAMDWEPPIPSDEIDEHGEHDAGEHAPDAHPSDHHADAPPPKHADDAHAGR